MSWGAAWRFAVRLLIAIPRQADRVAICCILRCMSATRTQVYLQPSQRRRLDEIAGSRGSSLAAVVREAVDLYIAHAPVDPTTALENTFGAAPDASFPGRGEWEVRTRRLRTRG